jgi:hypothetical protein
MTESPEDLSIVHLKSEFTKLAKMEEWTKNAFSNYELLKDMPPDWKLSGAIDRHKDEPLLLLGSGYTLDLGMPAIKKWQGKIMCGPSQVATLWHGAGRMPDYIVGFDSSERNIEYLRTDKLDYSRTVLITNPTWNPKALRSWINRGFGKLDAQYNGFSDILIYNICPLFHESITDQEVLSWGAFVAKYKPQDDHPVSWYLRDEHTIFFRQILLRAFPNIGFAVLSTPDTPSHSLILADLLGFSPIYCIGIDHGYVDQMNRCTMYSYDDEKSEWTKIPPVKLPTHSYISENGIWTDTTFISYKIATVAIARSMRGKVFEVTPEGKYGIDDTFKRCSTEEMLLGYAEDTETPLERASRAQEWLRTHNNGTWYSQKDESPDTQRVADIKGSQGFSPRPVLGLDGVIR